jgi:hypothetical protein
VDSLKEQRYNDQQKENFRLSALQEQLNFLRSQIGPQSLPELLVLCAELADSAPLLFLVQEAQERGIVLEESLGEVLLALSTSSLHKLLSLPGLEHPVKRAWTKATVEELVSFALLDRYLRRRAPQVWRDCLERIGELTREKLESGAAPDEHLTLRLQGSEQRRFRTECPQKWEPWSLAWSETAQKAVRNLAARPRGVSLANAERLLSQQVYTDQGHFLLELLQNADDAGASLFEVEFRSDAVIVSHNGVPFDFRDLVGVLSIGQTTKTERQIGYFGVGFKSVFEVTERPRIYSGHFAFEIIDISVPRHLSAEDNDPEKTTLHMPLKEGLTVEPYYERALEIEPTLLLNLPNVRRLRWTGPDGKVTELSQSQNGDLHSLTRTVSTGEESKVDFLVWKGNYKHTGSRPEGKPDEAEVMLAFPQASDGTAIPGGNLYSFLPIQEDSGLRFLVGSHFDVPVDRERLDQTSAWNRGILRAIPDIVKERCEHEPQALLPLLKLLPLRDDRVGPLFRILSVALTQKLKRLAILPRRGEFVRAEQAVVLEEQLAPLFSEDELSYFVQPNDDRTRSWLEQLGARTFDLKALLREVVRGKAPKRLLDKDIQAWQLFHKTILQDPSFETWEGHLTSVPLLLDQHGKMAAAKSLVLLSPEWEEVFHSPPPTVWSELRNLPETSTLIASLELKQFDWPHLLSHLREHQFSRVEPEALFRHLLQAPKQIQLACLQLPLYCSDSRSELPITAPGYEQNGLYVTHEDTPLELFSELHFCNQVKLLEPLLEAVGWRWFDRSQGLAYLQRQNWCPEQAQADILCRWLLSRSPDWATLEDLERLATLAIFQSREGSLRPLSELWQYEDPELQGLMPGLPQLESDSLSGQVVAHFSLQHLLGQANLGTLIDSFEKHNQQATMEFLACHAEELSRQQISRLLRKPLCQGKSVSHPDHPPAENVVEVADLELIELFLHLEVDVAPYKFSRQIVPLLEAAGFKPVGLKRLVEVLQEKAPPPKFLPQLHEYLVTHAIDLHLTHSENVLQSLPLWLCQDGEVRAARDIPPDGELAGLLDMEGRLPTAQHPEILAEMIPFLEPAEFLLNQVKTEVVPRGKLDEQPTWLNCVKKVDNVAQLLPHHHLCLDRRGVLMDTRLSYAPVESHSWLERRTLGETLLHPDSSQWQVQRARHLPARSIVENYLPFLEEPEMRQSFYQYLDRHLGQVVREEEARELLLTEPLWLNSSGQWHQLDQLVLEGGLPELGYDWFPHSEIPAELLEQLKSTLDVGRSDPESLLKNLMRSYKEKWASNLHDPNLLKAMVRIAEPLTSEQVQATSEWPTYEFPIYDSVGEYYRDITLCYAPPESLSGLSAAPGQESDSVGFLRKLGLGYLPPRESLSEIHSISPEDAEALEELVNWAWDERPDALAEHFSFLGTYTWIRNRSGELKAPVQLFLPTAEIEELIGSSPELYPESTRPQGLWRSLGVRDEEDISLSSVLKHLEQKIESGQRVSSRFYTYLESSLEHQTVTPQFLANSLSGLKWVWTDEGEYRHHKEVLGFPGYRYFGPHRGTWERAANHYPRLTSLFQIPVELQPEVVLRFLQHIASGEVVPPATRLVRNCLALLSEEDALVPRDWKVLPARQLPEGTEALVAACQKGVVRSNSPTLAALFGVGGTLWVVETDDPEHGKALEELYGKLGILRLRDSYTVHTDSSGTDVTEEMGDSVAAFRRLLSAIDKVLPRLRAARPEWNEGEWLAETHLRPFSTAAPISVIDGLQLVYTLQGVSSVTVTASIAYDPEEQRLLVSSQAVREPQQHAVELADGLVECIYQGPGSENLIDLLNLLLLFGNEKSMNSYLDQRHFPRPFIETGPGSEKWRRRLGEILDYGLHKVLERRHQELKNANWDAWRETNWQPAAETAEEFLKQISVSQPGQQLCADLKLMLESPELGLPSSESPALHQPEEVQSAQASVDKPATREQSESGAGFSVARLGKRLFNRLNDWLANEPAENAAIRLKTHSLDLAESYQHPPDRHLLVSDGNLKLHNLYCLVDLCSDFDPEEQEYKPGWQDWQQLFIPTGKSLQFSGSYGASSFPLPRPLYSRLAVPPVGQLTGPDEFHQYRLELDNPDVGLNYEVELCGVPNYQAGTNLRNPSPRLLQTTSDLDRLPAPVSDWIDWGQCSGLPHWQLAERALEFVMGAYQYDLNYLASERVHQIRRRPAESGENKFLSMLHAGGSGRILGRGVCVELSVLLLEVLRQCGVPSALGRVWMLDQGLIHVPDHVIALALVPTEHGPYWLPLDPSGQRVTVEQAESERALTRLELLEKAADILLKDQLPTLPESGSVRQQLLQQELLDLFGDANLMELFLECVAKPGRYRKELSPEFQELMERGFLEISAEQLYQIWVKPS